MDKIIAIANQKRSVDKTTTAINLAAALGILVKKILLIDTDPKANATSGLGLDVENLQGGTYETFQNQSSLQENVRKTATLNVFILPSHLNLVATEIKLVDNPKREYILKDAKQPVKDDYYYIIINCPFSLGLITLNAITAAGSVIIPIQCEYFALERLGKLLNTIKSVQHLHNQTLDIEGLLPTMYDPRLRLSNQVIEEIKTHFPKMTFETLIRRKLRINEALSFGSSIIQYDVENKGSINYFNLAHEFLKKQ
ncbi:MAG: ParA family protein [Flavobacteriales bacterium Tduv]